MPLKRASTRLAEPAPASVERPGLTQGGLQQLVIPDQAYSERLRALASGRRTVHRGAPLYRSGDRLTQLYVVQSGLLKTCILHEDGRSQVTGFHLSNEWLGLDGIGSEKHTCNAVALEDSEVCVIPFADLENYSREIGALQHHFHKVMSREIVRDHGVMMLLGIMRAEERLAAFLLNLSQRFTARGYSPTEFNLRMTRNEIGSYLGLKLETVSRAFSRFQEEGLITVHQKHIQILDVAGLKKLLSERRV